MLSYVGPPDPESVANLGTTGQVLIGVWFVLVIAIVIWFWRRR